VEEASVMTLSDYELAQACICGDMAQLRRWARRGIRVVSGLALIQAAA
jgi:hypothetical protein